MSFPSAVKPLLAAAVFLALLAVPASAAAPAATALPTITGTARAGQVLSSTTGLFAGAAPLTYGRAWQRCDEAGATCVPIPAASAATYTLAAADVGRTIRVTVTATNLEGAASASSAATATIAALAPPVNDAGGLPAVTGAARDGQVLTASDGAWSGTAPMTFTRLWQRCDLAGASCVPLASAATRTLTSADVGATIRVEVTARNADGQGVATSAQTAVVDAAAPVNTALPAVSGSARSGQTLTSSTTGTWTGTVPMTFTRQWTRCTAAGDGCAAIAGAAGQAYVLTDADIGATIRVELTATNVRSAATVASVASATVDPKVAPQKATDPVIAGAAIDGQTLTATDGTWTGTAPVTTARRWQRCAPLGLQCVELPATGTTLTLTTADIGSMIRTEVTATNPDGTTQAQSASTPPVGPAVPAVIAAPAVSGSAREGQVLTATQGTWKGTPAISYAYGWERCSAGACSAIAGETAATYRVAAGDVGRSLRAIVTASNGGGATSAPSAPTATVTGGVPVNVEPPAIAGALPRDGELFTSTLGAWTGTAPLQYDRQWLRCNALGAVCAPLSGEVAAGYRVAAADLGKTLRLEVTATNALGATKVQSAPSPVIVAAPPTADAPPLITGALRDGQTLTAVSAWSGSAPITLAHQWQRCDEATAACVDIAGATASTYRITSPDVGARMRVRIGALNAGGGGTATSDLPPAGDAAGVVAPDAPHATAAPILTGAAIEGSTLASSDATFTGTLPLTRTIRWQRCDATGSICAEIAGATGAARVLTAADRGATLRTIVTAVNGSGSDSIASAPSAVVAPAAPRNLVAPSIAPGSSLRDGATLTSTVGGWEGSQPLTLAYRWQRCKTANDCVDVPGARDASYMLATGDVGFALRFVVTASNGAGSASAPSALTGVVGTNPPVNVVAPTVAGIARDGESLTAVDGVWTGPIVYTTTYEWWRCDALGANCSIVSGATSRSLLLGTADLGLTLRARVVRTSAGGATAAFSAQTAAVVAAPPLSISAPAIAGAAAVGRTLSADRGSWSGTPALGFAYQWRRCAADGSACADVAGAVRPTYALTDDDGHGALRVVITATNAGGVVSATSAPSAEVQTDPPALLAPPGIASPGGPVAAGTTLTAEPGTWGGAMPVAVAYAWARCDVALPGCTPIAAASASTYVLAKADVGHRIVVTVTATNIVGSVTAATDPTTVVLPEPPSNLTLPVVTAPAVLREGARLVASTGTWNGATPLAYAITWLRCGADGAACAEVAGATGSTYTLTAADVGSRIRARVAAANATAQVSADSAPTAAVAPLPPPPPPPPAVTPRPPAPATPAAPAPVGQTTAKAPGTAATTAAPAARPAATATQTSTAKATTAAKKKAGATSVKPSAKPVAGVRRVRITAAGRLIVTLRCPRYRRRGCAAAGTVAGGTSLGEVIPGTSLRFTIRATRLPRGATSARSFKLTTAQLAELGRLTDVNFRVRLAAPGAPRRVNELFVRAWVPVSLRAPQPDSDPPA